MWAELRLGSASGIYSSHKVGVSFDPWPQVSLMAVDTADILDAGKTCRLGYGPGGRPRKTRVRVTSLEDSSVEDDGYVQDV